MLILNKCNFQKMLSNLRCVLIYLLVCVLEDRFKDAVFSKFCKTCAIYPCRSGGSI